MRIGGQQIDEAMIARMQHTIDEHPGLSRTAASWRICEELEWRSRNGRRVAATGSEAIWGSTKGTQFG